MAKSQSGFSRRYFFCTYKNRCSCQVAVSFSIKECNDRYELLQSGVHDRQSHVLSFGILSPKQWSAIVRAVKVPLSGPTEVLLNLKNLSPGKRVVHDVHSTCAVGRLVRKARGEVMASRTPGVLLDGSEGSMIEPFSRFSGTVRWLWNSRPGNAGLAAQDPAPPGHAGDGGALSLWPIDRGPRPHLLATLQPSHPVPLTGKHPWRTGRT